MKKFISKILLAWILLTEFTPVVFAASNSTKVTYGRSMISSDLQTVPDSTTAVTTTDTWIFQLVIANTTGGAVTITVSDRATAPKALLTTVSIAANTTYVIPFPEGQKMKNGFTWSASAASSLNASVVAWKI